MARVETVDEAIGAAGRRRPSMAGGLASARGPRVTTQRPRTPSGSSSESDFEMGCRDGPKCRAGSGPGIERRVRMRGYLPGRRVAATPHRIARAPRASAAPRRRGCEPGGDVRPRDTRRAGMVAPINRGDDDGRPGGRRRVRRDEGARTVKLQIASDLHLDSWPGGVPGNRAFSPAEGRDLLALKRLRALSGAHIPRRASSNPCDQPPVRGVGDVRDAGALAGKAIPPRALAARRARARGGYQAGSGPGIERRGQSRGRRMATTPHSIVRASSASPTPRR